MSTRENKRLGDTDSIYFIKAQNYITKKFGFTQGKDVNIVFCAILDIKRKYNHPNFKYEFIQTRMLEIGRNFNTRTLDDLLSVSDFGELMLHTINDCDFKKMLLAKKPTEVQAKYHETLNLFTELCTIKLSETHNN